MGDRNAAAAGDCHANGPACPRLHAGCFFLFCESALFSPRISPRLMTWCCRVRPTSLRALCPDRPAARARFFSALARGCRKNVFSDRKRRTARTFIVGSIFILYFIIVCYGRPYFLAMRFCCLLAAVIDKHLCAMLASIKRSPLRV